MQDQGPDISDRLKRYTIADGRLKELISEIWEIYRKMHIIIFVKSCIGELDDKDRRWLNYLFGKKNTEKILKDWDLSKTVVLKDSDEFDKDIEISKTKGMIYTWLGEIKERAKQLNQNRKYSQTLGEYNFPLNLINEILLLSPTINGEYVTILVCKISITA